MAVALIFVAGARGYSGPLKQEFSAITDVKAMCTLQSYATFQAAAWYKLRFLNARWKLKTNIVYL